MELIFEFLHTFQPSHDRKLETEVILAAFNNIYINRLTWTLSVYVDWCRSYYKPDWYRRSG